MKGNDCICRKMCRIFEERPPTTRRANRNGGEGMNDEEREEREGSESGRYEKSGDMMG